MKKFVLAATAASLLLVSATAYAGTPDQSNVRGKQIELGAAAINDHGRLLVPVRLIAETIGATVTWNPKSRTAAMHKWTETVKFTEGKDTAYFAKRYESGLFALHAPVRVVNDQVYVPVRFLSDFYGYQITAKDGMLTINSPFSQYEQQLLSTGELASVRRLVMDKASRKLHFANAPIPYLPKQREGYSTTYLFPVGEANRFFLLFEDTVWFCERQGDFFVVTWEANIPVGTDDMAHLLLNGEVTDATGPRPVTGKDFFYYRIGGLMTTTIITAGKLAHDGTVTESGMKRMVDGEAAVQTGTLELKLPEEKRKEA
ncbi:copper amine oxidase domain protein [Paenibacillus curdlanolyticus YK9]|uniref:Copper amine oxidase domain protein n=1 Tax=Paenibacillus curdlanolyticus YK9 TaxID=717606 RepID=E0IAS2_9BACL|nr:copper amine oxidase N-terminal domain-containing protein [Paenibacillus curdlanolyticus]EFM10476.1 copper amine oxidase domain protein [Paenibacillus curdlanolyticus YK9]